MKIEMNIKNILTVALPLFIIHAVEEFSTGLLKIDPFFRWVGAKGFSVTTFYIVEQILLVAILLWAIYKPKRPILILIGFLFIFEITHVVPALQTMSYYPGIVTAIPLVIVGIFYWKTIMTRPRS